MTGAKRYVKLPVEIEAMQFLDWKSGSAILDWAGNAATDMRVLIDGHERAYALEIATLEGVMRAEPRDWVIKGVQGEFYPCKPDIFHATYVEVLEEREPSLPQELTSLLNRYSAESVSGTPDFILVEFLLDSIKAFNAAVVKRADWRGESVELPALQKLEMERSDAD